MGLLWHRVWSRHPGDKKSVSILQDGPDRNVESVAHVSKERWWVS